MRLADEYVQAYNWASSGKLKYLYKEEDLSAKMVQAFDLIDAENAAILRKMRENPEEKKQ